MILRLVAVFWMGLSTFGAVRAQQAADGPVLLKQLGPNVWGAIDNPKAKQRSFSNAGIVLGADGVVVVDTLTGGETARYQWKGLIPKYDRRHDEGVDTNAEHAGERFCRLYLRTRPW